MTLADRMNHLGTETAFEVLAKARALEAQGRKSSTWKLGSRTSTLRGTSSKPGYRPYRMVRPTTGPHLASLS